MDPEPPATAQVELNYDEIRGLGARRQSSDAACASEDGDGQGADFRNEEFKGAGPGQNDRPAAGVGAPRGLPNLDEDRVRREKTLRMERMARRAVEIRNIKQQPQDEDEIQEIRSQSNKNEDGAFCTTLFTVCFLLHFFLEFGSGVNGSQYAIQEAVSGLFEHRILNLNSFDKQNASFTYLRDIKNVGQLPTFADYLVDVLYPLNRREVDLSQTWRGGLEGEAAAGSAASGGNQGEEGATAEARRVNATYLSSFNYFCGLQLNVRESQMVPNTYDHSKMVFDSVKPLDYRSALATFFLTKDYMNLGQGPEKDQTYSRYFGGDLSREQAFGILQDVEQAQWFNTSQESPMVNAEFKMVFYNQNDAVGLVLAYNFKMSNGGVLALQKTSSIFKPQNYVWDTLASGQKDVQGLFTPKILTLVIWVVISLFWSLYAVVDFLYRVRLFLYKRQFELDWFKYIEYWLLIMCIIAQVLWLELFNIYDGELFALPMNEASFMQVQALAQATDGYKRFAGLIAFVLMAKMLKALTSKFPAFGVLFETISAARMDLLYFTIMSCALALACTVICFCLFGPNVSFFRTQPEAAVSLLQMVFGRNVYDHFKDAYPDSALVFFMLFSILFYFVILNVYAAIVMRTYDNLRQRKQLLTEAMADIFAKQAEEHTNTFWAIIFCKVERKSTVDSDDEDAGPEGENEWEESNEEYGEFLRKRKLRSDYLKQRRKAQESQKNHRQVSSWPVRINHSLMTLKDYLNPNAGQMSLPEFEEKLKASKAKILKRRLEAREIRIRKFGGVADKSSFIKVWMSVVYCLFLILFYAMIDHQQQNIEAAQLTDLVIAGLVDDLSFVPNQKYKHIVERKTNEIMNSYRVKFTALDADKNGLLVVKELTEEALQAQGLTAEQQARIQEQVELVKKQNSTLSLNQTAFVEVMSNGSSLALEDLALFGALPPQRFFDVTEVGDIQDYLKGPIYNFLFERAKYHLDYPGNVIVASKGTDAASKGSGDEVARIMIQLFDEQPNRKTQTSAIFSKRTNLWTTSAAELRLARTTKDAAGADVELQPTRTGNFVEPKTGLRFEYFDNKDGSVFLTAGGQSGYMFSVPQDKAQAKELIRKLGEVDFYADTMKLAQINIDFVIYNVHYDIFASVRAAFWVDGAGFVAREIDVAKAEINHFKTETQSAFDQRKTSAMWCEALFLLFVLYETVTLYHFVVDEWRFITENLEEPCKFRQGDGFLCRFASRCRIPPQQIENQNFIVVIAILCKGIVMGTIELALKIWRLIKNTVGKSFFICLDVVALILFYGQIVVWSIIISQGTLDVDPETGRPLNVIQTCAGISRYNELYVQFTTGSMCLTFVRMLRYLTFSKKLSAFQEIMFSAAFDLLFFCLLWAQMLFGFAVAFFATYGLTISSFRDVSTSFFRTFQMSVNQFKFDEMAKVDYSFTVSTFILFQVTYRVLLSNMFIAIISAHYFQFQRESKEDAQGEEEVNAFQLVLSIVRNKLRQEQIDAEEDKAENPEQPEAKRALSQSKEASQRPRWRQTVDKYVQIIKSKIIGSINTMDQKLLGNNEFEDGADKQERDEEQERQRMAILAKYNQPDILEYKTRNKGLRPYIHSLNVAKMGPEALMEYHKNLVDQDSARKQIEPEQLVDSNIWLEVLEERIQMFSKYNLSLYDYQNHEIVYSPLLQEYDPKTLHILQKKLLKIPFDEPESRITFIKEKLRVYEQPADQNRDVRLGDVMPQESAKDTTESYKSQIDFLYLLWKALDFEQMFEAVNNEKSDLVFQLVELMNEEQNKRGEPEEDIDPALQGRPADKSDMDTISDASYLQSRTVKTEQKRKFKQEIADRAVIDHALLANSEFKKSNICTATDLQHHIWSQVLDHYERHQLWFNFFNTLDRVRLWNRLVFSEGYFRRLAHSSLYKRNDLAKFFHEKITIPIEQEEIAALAARREELAAAQVLAAELAAAPGAPAAGSVAERQKRVEDQASVKLTNSEQRAIRDKHYTPGVMREMWNMIKQRQYKVERREKQSIGFFPPFSKTAAQDSEKEKNKDGKDAPKIHIETMHKKDHMDMIRSLFNIMIHGVSHDRLIVLMDEALKKGPFNKQKGTDKGGGQDGGEDLEYQIYVKLVTETYDPGEYRLPLWLPLSLEQKLDMLMHQGITEEVELMQFLIDEEQGCGQNQQAPSLKKFEEVDKMLEQALDGLEFEKYMTLARMQATNASITRCRERTKNRLHSDQQLVQYAEWLEEKQRNAQKYEHEVRQQIKQQQKQNNQKLQQVAQQMKKGADKGRDSD